MLRKYGLVDVDNENTILEVYGMLRNGSLQTGDNFIIPLAFANHAVTVDVSGGMSAAGQTVPLTPQTSMHHYGQF